MPRCTSVRIAVTPARRQVAQELVHLDRQQPLVGHRLQVAVDRVDHHQAHAVVLDGAHHLVGELAGRELGGLDLLQPEPPVGGGPARRAEPLGAQPEGAQPLVEQEEAHALAARDGAQAYCVASTDLPVPAGR
jgi:hypothetical protein